MIGAISGLGQGLRVGPAAEIGGTSAAGATVLDLGTGSFGSILEQISTEVAQTLRAGEQVATKGVMGTASVQETVEGVMAAEQALQIGIGVRDKIVNAYLELSRMAI